MEQRYRVSFSFCHCDTNYRGLSKFLYLILFSIDLYLVLFSVQAGYSKLSNYRSWFLVFSVRYHISEKHANFIRLYVEKENDINWGLHVKFVLSHVHSIMNVSVSVVRSWVQNFRTFLIVLGFEVWCGITLFISWTFFRKKVSDQNSFISWIMSQASYLLKHTKLSL